MWQLFRDAAAITVISFILHIIWERAHISLYTGYAALEGVLPVYVFATIGDVAYTLLVLGVVAVFGGMSVIRTPRATDYLAFAVCGFFIALFVEYKAMALGRWAYTDAMPLIKGIGLSPLLQMTVLLPLTVYVYTLVERWRRG